MIKKVSFFSIFIFLIAVAISSINLIKDDNITTVDNYNPNNKGCVEDIVNKVSDLVEINNLNSLENYVTEIPESYKIKYKESMRRELKMDMETFQNLEREKEGKNIITKNPFLSFSNKKDLVKYAITISDFVSERNLEFTETESIKQKGKEAKAIVKFRGKDSSEIFEMLLYQTADGWKVFKFSFPNVSSDLYAEHDQ